MPLPPALQPWHDWLAWFAPDVAATVGAMLVTLDPLLGLPSPARSDDAMEPDGVDGLRRRGNYERLLTSEWVMADAMPDEFLRRAAAGEHLFLAPRLRTTKTDRTLVALFDAGPAQAGMPRLAHIALWILLARRAARAGARYAWGVLQTPGELHAADEPAMLAKLLEARTFVPVTATHRERWAAALDARDAGERWTIGADATATGTATHAAGIRRRLDGSLDVAIVTPRARRELVIAPPSNDVAARLLQGAFLAPRAAAIDRTGRNVARVQLNNAPLFSWDGGHVAVAVADESMALIFRIPRTAAETYREWPARWSDGTELHCATLDGRHFAGATLVDRHLRLWQLGNLRRGELPPDGGFRVVPGKSRWRWCELFRTPRDSLMRFIALDDGGALLEWSGRVSHAPATTIARGVVGAARIDRDHVLYATYAQSRLEIFRRRYDGAVAKIAEETLPAAPTRCLLAAHGDGRIVVATERPTPGGPRWRVAVTSSHLTAAVTRDVEIGENWKVIGLVRADSERAAAGYGLLALDADRRRLIVADAAGPPLHAARNPIATASTSNDGSRIALIDHARTLTVLDHAGAVLMHVQGNGGRRD